MRTYDELLSLFASPSTSMPFAEVEVGVGNWTGSPPGWQETPAGEMWPGLKMVEVVTKGEDGGEQSESVAAPSDPLHAERGILDKLKLDILREIESNGSKKIKVFSIYHRKTSIIDRAAYLRYEDLLQICGPPAKQWVCVKHKSDESTKGKSTIDEAREAVALLAGYAKPAVNFDLSAGCWRGAEVDGSERKSVVLVQAGEAAEVTLTDAGKSPTVQQIEYPRCGGHTLDFECPESWYDFSKLSAYIHQAATDPHFCINTTGEIISLFSKWHWHCSDESPFVVAGLILSSWIQTLWNWRPQIAVIGATNAGKTVLFNTMSKLFGGLALLSSKSSAPGVSQAIKTNASIVLMDEFDSLKPREKSDFLDMLRSSGRGLQTLKGTGGEQKGKRYSLRHIVWIAGINVAMKRSPDKNRFVFLEIKEPTEEHKKNFIIPKSAELADLGMRSLAVAITHSHDARILADSLCEERVPGYDSRVVESFAVPAAMLSTIYGERQPRGILETMLAIIDPEVAVSSDDDGVMREIFSAIIRIGGGERSIGQLLSDVVMQQGNWTEIEDRLESVGLKVSKYGKSKEVPHHLKSEKCLLIHCKAVSQHLLKNTDWAGQDISQILRRIPDALKIQRWIAGVQERCIALPLEWLKKRYINRDETE